MLTVEKVVTPSTEQWEIVIEGMRNPMNSWEKSDSFRAYDGRMIIGGNDMGLMLTLCKRGPEHAKFRRMIPVMLTVTAPTFWWIEFDTYKVGTVRNSCSKMHKVHVEPFTLDNFSHEGCDQIPPALEHLENTIVVCEYLRKKFNETQEKKFWRALIELLPHGYMMKATISLNYEVLCGIYHSRKNHKLDEWRTFCEAIERLPYSEIITA